VGDEDFQERSRARTEELMNGGCAVLLVTHDLATVRTMASRAIYLDHGVPRANGKPDEVIDRYLADLHK
jgi:ABC-type branched-subunit amino acid transport system ATPase component